MKEKDLTMEILITAAEDLSKLFEQPIETGEDETDFDLLKKDLIEAGAELQEGDEITDQSKEVLVLFGVELPFKEEEKEEVENGEEGDKKEEKEKEKPEEKQETASKGTSNIAIMKVLLVKKASDTEINKEFMEKYKVKGIIDSDFIARRITTYKNIAKKEIAKGKS